MIRMIQRGLVDSIVKFDCQPLHDLRVMGIMTLTTPLIMEVARNTPVYDPEYLVKRGCV